MENIYPWNLSELSLNTLTSDPRGRFDGIRNDHFAQTEALFTRKKFETFVHSRYDFT